MKKFFVVLQRQRNPSNDAATATPGQGFAIIASYSAEDKAVIAAEGFAITNQPYEYVVAEAILGFRTAKPPVEQVKL